MAFNIALSGLKAASSDLEITGNNIANASTTGFKASRAEFGDVYANSILDVGNNQIGSGVRLDNVSQQFSQGTISFTESTLDLAINGSGFFVLDDSSGTSYTRSGDFGLDDDGFIVSNTGSRLQGFPADDDGTITSVAGDIQITTGSIEPALTSEVDIDFNLDASEEPPLVRTFSVTSVGSSVAQAQLGGNNGYTAGTVDLNGITQNIPSADNLTAAEIAAELSALNGVSATATTTAMISNINFGSDPDGFEMLLNSNSLESTTLEDLAEEINSIPGFTADFGTDAGTLIITNTSGSDINFTIDANAETDTGLTIEGFAGDPLTTTGNAIAIAKDSANEEAVVGGEVFITLEDAVELTNAVNPDGSDSLVFGNIDNPVLTSLFEFDPTDPDTYNHATSVTVYDSLGNDHVMTQYFVKEPVSTAGEPNVWTMYVQIDGQDIGPPSPTTEEATLASYTLRFDEDGALDVARSDVPVIVNNWTPQDDLGVANGSVGPDSTTTDVLDPPVSSNFEIDILGSTQFSGGFEIDSLDQDGFALGQLTSLEVNAEGVIFARYTNGEALTLGQVVLADFTNDQGLRPVGNTAWVETSESGPPIVASPESGTLGSITASALEDSNVDLSQQLVQLIIAQRNFQANAKTIETSDSVTQSIINLR